MSLLLQALQRAREQAGTAEASPPETGSGAPPGEQGLPQVPPAETTASEASARVEPTWDIPLEFTLQPIAPPAQEAPAPPLKASDTGAADGESALRAPAAGVTPPDASAAPADDGGAAAATAQTAAAAVSSAAAASAQVASEVREPEAASPAPAPVDARKQAKRRVALWGQQAADERPPARKRTAVLAAVLAALVVVLAALWGWQMWGNAGLSAVATGPATAPADGAPAAATEPPAAPPAEGPSEVPPTQGALDMPNPTADATSAGIARAAQVSRRVPRTSAAKTASSAKKDQVPPEATPEAPTAPPSDVALQPTPADPVQVARQATAEQNWSAAAQAWADVLRQQPRSLEAWLGSGLALYQTQRFEQALQAYQRALAVDPRSEAARQGWWTVLARVDPPQASLALQSWLEEHASDAAAWRALGQAQARLRRWADASQAWERALALDAQRADVWANLGVALDHLKRHAQAASAYEQALRWPMPEASRRQIELRLAALRRALSDPQGEDTP